MTSAAPARKPYRKAPPQHRETRHAPPLALPTPAPQHDLSQVKQHRPNTPPTTLLRRSPVAKQPPSYRVLQRGGPKSDSELDASSLSSLELGVPPSGRFSPSQRTPRVRGRTSQSPAGVRRPSPGHRCAQRSPPAAASPAAPRSILKQPGGLGVKHTYDIIRKSQSVELLGDGKGEDSCVPQPPSRSLRRGNWRRSSDAPDPCGTGSSRKVPVLKEKVRFSNFLDEITCRVMSPALLSQLGKPPYVKAHGHAAVPARSGRRQRASEETSAERSRRWDHWVSAVRRPKVLDGREEAGHRRGDSTDKVPWKRERGVKRDTQKRHKGLVPLSHQSVISHSQVGLHSPPVGLEFSWRTSSLGKGSFERCTAF